MSLDDLKPWTEGTAEEQEIAQLLRGYAVGYRDGFNMLGCPDPHPDPTPYSTGYDKGYPAGMAEHEALKGKIVGLLGDLLLRGRGNMLKSLMDSWKAEDAVDRRERLESLSAAFRDDWIQ